MRCPNHLLREAVGYCNVCGTFGCADCMHFHEGVYYCKRDFKPIQDELDRNKRHEEQKHRADRQRLVVHTKKGEIHFGVCFAMNLANESFKMDLMDRDNESLGKNMTFLFRDLKAVFYVKSFDGQYDRNQVWSEQHQQGRGIVLEFNDGEVLKGHTYQAYHEESPRFHFIPEDQQGNNVSVIVERSALKAVYTPEGYQDEKKREFKDWLKEHQDPAKDQEEIVGDFHFAKKDYHRAARHYYKAIENAGPLASLTKKIVVSEYNTAMQYIREKHLTHALHHLEKAHKLDAANELVNQRIAQLRDRLHLDKTSGRQRVQ